MRTVLHARVLPAVLSLGVLRLGILGLVLGLLGCDAQRDRNSAPRSPDDGRPRIVAGSAAALDWLAWLALLDEQSIDIVGVPVQAERYANGLPPDGFVDRAETFANFRAEALLRFDPDLVLCDDYQSPLTIRALESAGVAVVTLLPVRTFEDLETNLTRVIMALDEQRTGIVDGHRARLRLLEERNALFAMGPATRARVLPYYDLGGQVSSAGEGTSEALLLRLAGAIDIACELGLQGHGKVSIERLLSIDVDWFLVSEGAQVASLRRRASLAPLRAMREESFLVLSSRLRQASSPYVLEAARRVRSMLDRAARATSDAGRDG
ncbi:MAG: ABC transporter substrate-binding protein [Planctomycetes bacterium]|nr:ABC transporter substrate-binding protein [Planctomycetota bacterium]